jgi:hypothetical protein
MFFAQKEKKEKQTCLFLVTPAMALNIHALHQGTQKHRN